MICMYSGVNKLTINFTLLFLPSSTIILWCFSAFQNNSPIWFAIFNSYVLQEEHTHFVLWTFMNAHSISNASVIKISWAQKYIIWFKWLISCQCYLNNFRMLKSNCYIRLLKWNFKYCRHKITTMLHRWSWCQQKSIIENKI